MNVFDNKGQPYVYILAIWMFFTGMKLATIVASSKPAYRIPWGNIWLKWELQYETNFADKLKY